MCSCLLSTLPTGALNTLVLVVLNSWPDNSNLSAVSVLMLALSLQALLSFGMPCTFYFTAGHDVLGISNCLNRPLVVWW